MSNEIHQIDIAVDTVYVEEQSKPDEDRYGFAYTITIENNGTIAARLVSRHWIITDGAGHVQEVRGDGVVGEHPKIGPGESFRYTSAAMIETPVGTMHGSYQMVADDGTKFDAPIAAFRLSVPNILH